MKLHTLDFQKCRWIGYCTIVTNFHGYESSFNGNVNRYIIVTHSKPMWEYFLKVWKNQFRSVSALYYGKNVWCVCKVPFLKMCSKVLAIHHFRCNICYTLSKKRYSQPPIADGLHRYNCHAVYREIQCEKWKIMCSHTNGHWTRHRLIFHIMSSLRFE